FRLAVARRPAGGERGEQAARRLGHLVDGTLERRLVGARRLAEPAQLAHELQRGGADFLLPRRRVEVKERTEISAHGPPLCGQLDVVGELRGQRRWLEHRATVRQTSSVARLAQPRPVRTPRYSNWSQCAVTVSV